MSQLVSLNTICIQHKSHLQIFRNFPYRSLHSKKSSVRRRPPSPVGKTDESEQAVKRLGSSVPVQDVLTSAVTSCSGTILLLIY